MSDDMVIIVCRLSSYQTEIFELEIIFSLLAIGYFHY